LSICISGKSPGKTVKRTRSLFYLLDRSINLQENIDDQNSIWITYPEKYYAKKRVIAKYSASNGKCSEQKAGYRAES
jgi:hypothetical protein